MKKVIVVLAVIALAGVNAGCSKKENSQSAVNTKVEQTGKAPGQMNDGELALAFLGCVQNNDKKLMYEISSLTPEMVEESRVKLTNAAKYKLSVKERAEIEHALRMSGSIDFYLKKMTKIIPKSAQLQLVKTTQEGKSEGAVNVHLIKVSYKKEEALVDKKGQQIKEMTVKLQQIKHLVDGHTLQEFVFDSSNFEKMADKEYDILSTY